MKKAYLVIAVAALGFTLASGTSSLAAQKGGGGSSKDAGKAACIKWCTDHNKKDTSTLKCWNRCDKYYGPGISRAIKSNGGTVAAPIKSGKPVNTSPVTGERGPSRSKH
jgi:hypothetical protein